MYHTYYDTFHLLQSRSRTPASPLTDMISTRLKISYGLVTFSHLVLSFVRELYKNERSETIG